MSRGFFSYLNWAVPKTRDASEELSYDIENRGLFPGERRKYDLFDSPFSILRAYALLRSLKRRNRVLSLLSSSAKETFSTQGPSWKKIFSARPYFLYDSVKIYFPFYSPYVNQRFVSNPASFYSFPYQAFLKDSDCSLVDPLQEYGSHLYSFSCLRLKKLPVKDIDSSCYYLEKEGILFFIDSAGYLETRIPFFDEGRKKDYSHLSERLSSIALDYYSNDFGKLSRDLIHLSLLSPSIVLSAIKSKEKQNKEKHDDL